MKTQNENSSEPRVHSEHIQQQLDELIQHARADIERVTEPRFQALLETSAEVLTGLKRPIRIMTKKRKRHGTESAPDTADGLLLFSGQQLEIIRPGRRNSSLVPRS